MRVGFGKIFELVTVFTVIISLFSACEKDDRPVFSSSQPSVLAENDSNYIGIDKTILIYDTFQVSFTVTPGEGNLLDEVVIERILRGIKTNVDPDSQPYGNSYRYIDEFIADSVTGEEQFRFTFLDNRANLVTKVLNIKTATMLRDSTETTILSQAARNNSSIFAGSGYSLGWDLTNEKFVKYQRSIITNAESIGDSSTAINEFNVDSINPDIISFEASGSSFNGGFQSLNGRQFAQAPNSWRLDSITDRDCEEMYNHKASVDSLFTQFAATDSGNVFITMLPGNVEYQVIKITEVDKDFIPSCNLPSLSDCGKGALSFKTIKKLKL